MLRNKSSGQFCLPRQLVCIICVMLIGGCAVPCTELSSRRTASGLSSATVLDSEHSPVRLAAAEQPAPNQSEPLPDPKAADQSAPIPDIEETADLPAGKPLSLDDAIALAFQRQP